VDDEPRRLVDDEQVLVRERRSNVAPLLRLRLRLLRDDPDLLAGRDPVALRARNTVDEDEPASERALRRRSRSEDSGEEAV
jgi:hypothetical protein